MDKKLSDPSGNTNVLYGKPVIDYLKSLERQSGQAVQLEIIVRVKTTTDSNDTSIELCGNLEDRPLRLKRVENLPGQYQSDLALLEGEYPHFKSLEERMEVLELIYSKPLHHTTEGISAQEKAKFIVGERWPLPRPDLPLAFNLFIPGREGQDLYGNEGSHLVSQKEVFDYLHSRDLKFLKHNYSAQLRGLYVRVSSAAEKIGEGSLRVSPELKVAEVHLKRL